MKLNKYSLALILGFGMLTSCNDRLELLNPTSKPQVHSALILMTWRNV